MVLSIIGTTLLISSTADHPVWPGARYFSRARIIVRDRGDVTRIAGVNAIQIYNAPMLLAFWAFVMQARTMEHYVGYWRSEILYYLPKVQLCNHG